jgi:hypothetical protein
MLLFYNQLSPYYMLWNPQSRPLVFVIRKTKSFKKEIILYMTEPIKPVLYVVKPLVETISVCA